MVAPSSLTIILRQDVLTCQLPTFKQMNLSFEWVAFLSFLRIFCLAFPVILDNKTVTWGALVRVRIAAAKCFPESREHIFQKDWIQSASIWFLSVIVNAFQNPYWLILLLKVQFKEGTHAFVWQILEERVHLFSKGQVLEIRTVLTSLVLTK